MRVLDEAHVIDFGVNEQKTPELLSLKPNCKLQRLLIPTAQRRRSDFRIRLAAIPATTRRSSPGSSTSPRFVPVLQEDR
jgi:hypothetical protein